MYARSRLSQPTGHDRGIDCLFETCLKAGYNDEWVMMYLPIHKLFDNNVPDLFERILQAGDETCRQDLVWKIRVLDLHVSETEFIASR